MLEIIKAILSQFPEGNIISGGGHNFVLEVPFPLAFHYVYETVCLLYECYSAYDNVNSNKVIVRIICFL